MENFQNKVKEHLSEYKRKTLNVEEKGVFFHKGKNYEYEHIIPKEQERLNILEEYRSDFYSSSYSGNIKFHRYFHHLNSSQAMCINCFYPLIKENLLETVLKVIGIDGDINYNSNNICFEKESELEKKSERKTNFDFFIKLNSGIKLFFEIKYTEVGFGKAKQDKEHRDKFINTYEFLLDKNPAIKEIFKTEETFLNNYQIMRNLLNINNESYIVFLYPKDNSKVNEEALLAQEMIEEDWKNHLILFTWEDFIKKIESNISSEELIDYYSKEFAYKYLKY